MVLSLVAVPASAQTTAELTAQINSLLAMITQLQAQIASLNGGATVATTFNTDLTVGSKGADVTALQQFLVSKGDLVMPTGVSYGYFGPLTKAAVAAYQASVGITPAVGYFGPITRANVNALNVATGSTTTGNTITGGNATDLTGITTPGVEGTISATASNSGLVSTAYEGDTMVGILGVKIEANNSDMAIQRVKLRMDETTGNSDTKFYNKIYKKLYVTDGTNVLASVDLNSTNVYKDGSNYYITISGFNFIVPKDTTKTLVIKADLYSAIDSTDYDTETYQLGLAANGVRAVDGAGIDEYAGGTTDNGIARTTTIAATLIDSSSITVSLNSSTPRKNDVVCTSGSSQNECDKLTLLVFDVKAEKDDVKITDINIANAKTGAGGAKASSTIYLYDGSTELDNASVGTLNTAIFSNFDQIIPKGTTKTYTVKTDIRSANTTRASFVASASSTGITAENSVGDSVSTKSGTATGYSIGILNVGPEFTLASKSISTNGVPQANGTTTNVSTSTITATFNVKVKAVGGAIEFGTSQATTSPFVASTTGFSIYRDGAADTTLSSNATSTSITFPATCTTAGFTNSCSLAEGNEVTVPVSFQLQGRTSTGAIFTSGLYSIGLARLNWIDPANGLSSNTTFMSGETDWRTSDVSFP